MNAQRVPRVGLARAAGAHLIAANDAERAACQPSIALARKAIRLFKSEHVERQVWKASAAKWLACVTRMGKRHLLEGGSASWGMPGDPISMHQGYAPRRARS